MKCTCLGQGLPRPSMRRSSQPQTPAYGKPSPHLSRKRLAVALCLDFSACTPRVAPMGDRDDDRDRHRDRDRDRKRSRSRDRCAGRLHAVQWQPPEVPACGCLRVGIKLWQVAAGKLHIRCGAQEEGEKGA